MLLVRRRAPAGSYFEDGDRAAGVFGVLATGFAVLLGFVVFLAFESFDTSRSGAETEAQIVTQQFETAQFFPVAARAPPLRRTRLLRADGDPPGVAADGGGHPRRQGQSVGRRHVPHPQDRRAAVRLRAGGIREMARPALRPRERARRPYPRRRGGDPGAALDRAAAQRGDHLRVHAVLRRQRRARRSCRRR